jgi:hypothetical protein
VSGKQTGNAACDSGSQEEYLSEAQRQTCEVGNVDKDHARVRV